MSTDFLETNPNILESIEDKHLLRENPKPNPFPATERTQAMHEKDVLWWSFSSTEKYVSLASHPPRTRSPERTRTGTEAKDDIQHFF